MIKKVLIANRGEIACRVIRTLNRLGIASVAVYSEPDRDALHVSMADESVHIGAGPASESYLCIDKLVQAAKQCGADAVHPGYGFLSENPQFVRALDDADIIFIGPDAPAIEAMGLKDAAKIRMEKAGVPVVPGYHGEEQDPALLAREAELIGYPVLIKARAGGGGKGMRRVDRPGAFAEALAGAQREAAASFSDDRVLVEKYVSTPRHIEVQVFGDRLGNVVHLFERDCSSQRRHQKVIEEAPAPGMNAAMRAAMGEAAVRAAQAVNYVGAGTVEFIVDASEGLNPDGFYFMEMNTRLQVEHPVTEFITGIDLVEWQIAVANGLALPLEQSQITLNGHAFEARIYAEDADNNFLPATGTLDYFHCESGVRLDTGVRQGDQISPFYDPMIAKLVVHSHSRERALSALTTALAGMRIAGTITNLGFLYRLANLDRFRRGDVETGLIDRHMDKLTRGGEVPFPVAVVAGLQQAGLLHRPDSSDPWQRLKGWREWSDSHYLVALLIDGQRTDIAVNVLQDGATVIETAARAEAVRYTVDGRNDATIRIGKNHYRAGWFADSRSLTVFFNGESWPFRLPDPAKLNAVSAEGENDVIAPMPGSIISVRVNSGDTVQSGEILVVMEAMKMEHTLAAPRDATVECVNIEPGEQVEAGKVLLSLQFNETG